MIGDFDSAAILAGRPNEVLKPLLTPWFQPDCAGCDVVRESPEKLGFSPVSAASSSSISAGSRFSFAPLCL
jgi:hypothetical protein